MVKCAFIGLGNMGYPMAGHLARAGHDVAVFNRTTAKAEAWAAEHGGRAESSPAAAAAGAEFVFVCVGADDDVRQVLLGDEGALDALAPGAIVVDHTTASVTLAEELDDACGDRGLGFVDAPVSGGQAGAESGVLSVMCGGRSEHYEAAAEVMDAYAKTMILVGPAGSGQRTKMVNQILCAGAIQGAAEALAFGQRAGLDMDKVLAAVSQGAAASWYLTNRGETMVADEFDFGFAVDWMVKDLSLVR
ncbi:MAG: NAD(P)-dependent oxidoreductase, partial [Acidimicrobiia bacterium]|nr:NAD(P)-dependent oxidoreductase [Acidimicrobiia bacterium]